MKKVVKYTVVVAFVIISLYFIQRLLMPKYMDDIVEGALIAEYYQDADNEVLKDHDIVFIGDCEVYENFSPITLWEEYGLNTYIRGSAQQLIWQSYYLLEETLRYETPDVVVFNVLSMKYDEPQNEAYNRMTIDGMRWSQAKVGSINASMLEEENFLDYVFPLLRYHSRWSDISMSDFKYMFSKEKIAHNGYYMRVDTKGVTDVPKGRPLSNYQFGDNSYYYLNKMVELCKEKGVELVLVKAPSLSPYWYEEWEVQMEDYAKKHNLMYINYLELIDEVGLDFMTDTYDLGLHLNLAGAEKLSKYFGKQMVDGFGLENRQSDKALSKEWEKKKEFYYGMKDAQFKELEEYGKIISY